MVPRLQRNGIQVKQFTAYIAIPPGFQFVIFSLIEYPIVRLLWLENEATYALGSTCEGVCMSMHLSFYVSSSNIYLVSCIDVFPARKTESYVYLTLRVMMPVCV